MVPNLESQLSYDSNPWLPNGFLEIGYIGENLFSHSD